MDSYNILTWFYFFLGNVLYDAKEGESGGTEAHVDYQQGMTLIARQGISWVGLCGRAQMLVIVKGLFQYSSKPRLFPYPGTHFNHATIRS